MKLELIPLRNGVPAAGGTLGVMLRITPPQPEVRGDRPRLNLALVIDRSGSMSGAPLEHAKLGAIKAVENLLPSDRVAVVTYDDHIDVLVPSTLARDKAAIIRAIRGVRNGGTTALHGGWLEGASQVGHYLEHDALNRVVLLSDGLANVGETNLDVICSDVLGLRQRGVGTTAIGLGRSYNEDLLQGMADAGGGNYYFVESPQQLASIFEAELHGLSATLGTGVRLAFGSPLGVSVTEILNDLPQEEGRLVLPNLVAGLPIEIGATLAIPPLPAGEANLGDAVLFWSDPTSGAPFEARAPLQLEALGPAAFGALPENPEVRSYFEELRVARLKEAATQALDQGDRATTQTLLKEAREVLSAAPMSARIQAEFADLGELDEAFRQQDDQLTRKRLTSQVYRKQRSFYHERLGTEKPPQRDAVSIGSADGSTVTLEIALGDITDEQIDAIVNPTNQGLFGTGPTVDGAVHRKGGPELTQACRAIGHCELGKAVFTDGYRLPARYVIHTAVPTWQGGESDTRLLESCYRASLELARRLQVRTLALPAIGTGANGFPREVASKVAVKAVLEHARANQLPEKIRFVCFDVLTREAYRQALAEEAGGGSGP